MHPCIGVTLCVSAGYESSHQHLRYPRGAVHGANATSTCERKNLSELANTIALAGGGVVRSMDCPSTRHGVSNSQEEVASFKVRSRR
jgi:hypothetical protein